MAFTFWTRLLHKNLKCQLNSSKLTRSLYSFLGDHAALPIWRHRNAAATAAPTFNIAAAGWQVWPTRQKQHGEPC